MYLCERIHMTRLLSRLTVIAVVLITAVCCTDRPKSVGNGYVNDDGYNHADSIVSDIGDQRDFQKLLVVVDSFQQTGDLSQVKCIFYKTIAYNIMGQQSSSLRLYYQLAGIDIKELTTQADLDSYIYSYNNYVRLLCDMRRYDRALREANTVDHKLKEAGHEGFADHHDIAQIIGECQIYLQQDKQAAESFQKSLKGVHTRLARYHEPLDYRECQKTMNAIAKTYIRKHRYAEAEPWMKVQDSLFNVADHHPHRDSIFIDEMKADINYSKALLAIAQGRTADAELAYNQYLSTNTAKQPISIINSCEYLMQTHRYLEAARHYEQLDDVLIEGGYKASLDNFSSFMMPKFRANLLAGRRDSALATAEKVATYYDTALIRQKMIDADLLTTVYDTEGKERKIAEQRAELSQQRLLSIAVVMVILVISFVIYIVQRRRAFHKLNATNQQLILANERAKESSRMKSKFIQQISHEVRTPLNVLSGFTQVLAAPDIEISKDEFRSISKKIINSSDRVTHLIDKMLDLSLINSQADIECNDSVRPAELASQAIEQSGIRQAEHLDFQLQVSSEAETCTIVTNKESAVKALTQLLDNAAKFTHPLALKQPPTQKPHVTLSVTIDDHNVSFMIEDTGIGIPADQAENVFNEFVQLNEYIDGTGIGLTIARSLARHMGGDILLDTTYTDGARFVMQLPLDS